MITMTEPSWIFAMDDNELPKNGLELVFPGGNPVLLIKTAGGEVFAMMNKCAHASCPMMGGALEGYILECPCHYWKFDVRTGEYLEDREITIPTYPCKVEDGKVFVKIVPKQ